MINIIGRFHRHNLFSILVKISRILDFLASQIASFRKTDSSGKFWLFF